MWLKISTLYTATLELLKCSREMTVNCQRQRCQNHRGAFIGAPLVNMDEYYHHKPHSKKHENFLVISMNFQRQNYGRNATHEPLMPILIYHALLETCLNFLIGLELRSDLAHNYIDYSALLQSILHLWCHSQDISITHLDTWVYGMYIIDKEINTIL